MELKVLVDGTERSLSGLTDSTTCAQIIYALAHATGQKGSFVLVEKYRDSERSLASTDRPLEMLKKWDDRSRHVFILKHLDNGISQSVKDSHPRSLKNLSSQSMENNSLAVDSDASVQSATLFLPERSSSPILKAQSSRMEGKVDHPDCRLLNGSHNYNIPPSTSTTSIRSAAPILSRKPPNQFEVSNRPTHSVSSVSLPCFSLNGGPSVNRRPPPPAYHKVIELRYNSLNRGGQTLPKQNSNRPNDVKNSVDLMGHSGQIGPSSSLYNFSRDTVPSMNLSRGELEGFVESQRRTVEQQKSLLSQIDRMMLDDDQRELLQLERQQENLHLVLNPLREIDWANRICSERAELQRIQSEISEVQRNVDKATIELNEQWKIKENIKEQIGAIKREIEELESDDDDVNDIDDVDDDDMLGLMIS